MKKPVIHLGDPTTTGGVVITASPTSGDYGKPIARNGDIATCPVCDQHQGAIVTTSQLMKVDGQYVARQDDIVACGCPYGSNKLISVGQASMLDDTQKPKSGGFLGWIRGALDAVGLIPGIGSIASAVSLGIDVVEGDGVERGFNHSLRRRRREGG
jgi:uncharacterized Zn-binding protein involved in type VI secretion